MGQMFCICSGTNTTHHDTSRIFFIVNVVSHALHLGLQDYEHGGGRSNGPTS